MKETKEIREAFAVFQAAQRAQAAATDARYKAFRSLVALIGDESVDGLLTNHPMGSYVSDADLVELYPDIFAELAKVKSGRVIKSAT